MSEPFNPYRDWLNIPENDLPPDHYQLLGLAPLEPDEARIGRAADERMKLLRTFQSGKHAHESQQLLNEVAAARLCLLNPEKRRRYDAALQERRKALDLPPLREPFQPFPKSQVEQDGEPPAPEPLPDESGRMLPAPRSLKQHRLTFEWWWIVSIVGILAVLILVFSLLWYIFI